MGSYLHTHAHRAPLAKVRALLRIWRVVDEPPPPPKQQQHFGACILKTTKTLSVADRFAVVVVVGIFLFIRRFSLKPPSSSPHIAEEEEEEEANAARFFAALASSEETEKERERRVASVSASRVSHDGRQQWSVGCGPTRSKGKENQGGLCRRSYVPGKKFSPPAEIWIRISSHKAKLVVVRSRSHPRGNVGKRRTDTDRPTGFLLRGLPTICLLPDARRSRCCLTPRPIGR